MNTDVDAPVAISARGTLVVVGASGFVGSNVVPILARRGWTIVALMRNRSQQDERATWHRDVDFRDSASIAETMRGADAVLNLAARAHILDDRASGAEEEAREVNAELPRRLAEAAVRAQVRRFVHLSSVKVVGSVSDSVLNEESPPIPTDTYGRTKLEGERHLEAIAKASGLRVAILRLPLVHGPHAKANLDRLMRAVQRGMPLPLGGFKNRRSVLGVANLAHAIDRSLLAPLPHPCRTFFIADPGAVSSAELARLIGDALGRSARIIPLPIGLLRAALGVSGAFKRIIPRLPDRSDLLRLTGSLEVSIVRAQRELSYNPEVSTVEGVRSMTNSFLQPMAR